MRRILTILALLFYLGINSGMAINVHYCGDHVSGFGLSDLHQSSCCEKGASCCSDKVAYVNPGLDQIKYENLTSTFDLSPAVVLLPYSISPSKYENRDVFLSSFKKVVVKPPHLPPNDVYLLNQVFRL